MSKKKNKNKNQEEKLENYYKLKVKETDELVAALKGENLDDTPMPSTNIAEITGEEEKPGASKRSTEFDPYKTDKLSRIPCWIIALFVKWWFAGAVCYFVIMGLGMTITDTLDMTFVSGAVLGLLTELMVNPIFRMLESDKKQYNNFMMFPFPFKAYWTFFTNIIYYIIVVFLVSVLYAVISINIVETPVEPLLFGTLVLIVDMAFIGIKDLIVYLVKKTKTKKEKELDV